jgi:hypothetical protein
MHSESSTQKNIDLLAIFHYVLAAITLCFCLFPGIYMALGVFMLNSPQAFAGSRGGSPPPFIGWFMVGFASVFILAIVATSVLMFLAGWFLHRRKHHLFCMIVAAIECFNLPLGTVLGVLTLVVLTKPEAEALFQQPPALETDTP